MMTDQEQKHPLAPVARWLWLCAGMVFMMALIGAITRLTESGLSIVRWQPIGGAIPPLSVADWQVLFEQYRQTPQYLQINHGMSLEEFQGIFWWEWIHRQWGRLIGLAYALPLLWFTLTRRVTGRPLLWLCALLLLGALQGLVGWIMVASGLVDMPSVSHYRLALHLLLAALLMALLITAGLAMTETRPRGPAAPGRVRLLVRLALGLLSVTIIWGAFVAGLDAGLIYNEFPHMGTGLFPAEGWQMSPWWRNFLENHATVQFAHRWLAVTTALIVSLLGLEVIRNPNTSLRGRRLGVALIVMVWLQVSLGVATLLTGIDLHLAVTHQGGALVLLALLTVLRHEMRHRPAPAGRI